MIEFIRQSLETMQSGMVTHFQIYVVFVWLTWLPAAFGAGIFMSFRPAEPLRLTPRYLIALAFGFGLIVTSTYYWTLEKWSFWGFMGALAFSVFVMAPPIRRRIVRFLFSWTFYANHVRLVDQVGPHGERVSVAMMTIFDESPEFLEKNAAKIRRCLELAGGEFTLMGIIDGYGRFQHAADVVPVAMKHFDIVMTTNAQHKRTNLFSLYTEARKRKLLETGKELIHFIDSDTIPRDDQVAIELIRPFADPRVGGVTTAQYVYQPENFTQHICQLLETIRNFGSQLFLALWGAILCLPGRWYVVLAECLTDDDMAGLMNDSFSWFGFMRHPCAAGDDRFISNVILRKGYRSIIAVDAVVYTLAPALLEQARKMWTRWARSSNGYNIRETPHYARRPWQWPALFTGWRNILLTFGTCYIVYLYWPYSILFGDASIVLWQALILALVSMTARMMVGFSPVWNQELRYLKYMPIMGPVGIYLMTIQLIGIVTHVHKIGSWGTRAGADDERDATLKVAVIKG